MRSRFPLVLLSPLAIGWIVGAQPAAPTNPQVEAVLAGGGITCTPNRTAASAARADVLTEVNEAVSGDTICVPDGTATWTSAITLPSNKDLIIAGNAGADPMTVVGTPGASNYTLTYTATGTHITCNAGCFGINLAANHRITGFHLISSADDVILETGDQASGTHFELDHNRFQGTTAGWQPNRFFGGSNGFHPQGILYRNRIEWFAFHANGTNWNLDDAAPGGNAQHVIWAKEPTYGGTSEVVYYEDNYIVNSATNFTDGNYGCRRVERFNTVADSGVWTFEVHGMQGLNRGCQQTEVYHNYVGGTGGGFSEIRGGSGFMFGNVMASGVTSGINLTIDRSEYDEAAGNFGQVKECGVGGADGNSPTGVDQQTGGSNGWRCRDQVGTSHDAAQWSHSPQGDPTSFGAWNQTQRALGFWSNTHGAGALSIDVNTQGDIETVKVLVSREFYCDTGFSGGACGSGVQIGTSLPGACTVGQLYWKTDEGEWNSNQGGNDGRLYRCSSTNTWTLYYTPYTYPHPWTN